MTTKWKIIAGFIIMIALTGAVAGIGYSSLDDAMDAFTEYRNLARFSVNTSDMLAGQNSATSSMRQFIITTDSKWQEGARNAVGANQKLFTDSKVFATGIDKKSMDFLEHMQAYSADQLKLIDPMEKSILATVGQYTKTMHPAMQAMSAGLEALGEFAVETKNDQLTREVLKSMDELGTMRGVFARLAYTRSKESVDRAAEVLTAAEREMKGIEATLQTEQGRAAYAKLQTHYASMASAAAAMRSSAVEAMDNTAKIVAMNAKLTEEIAAISAETNKQQYATAVRIVQDNERARTFMLGVTAAGLFVGVLLAVFIIFGLVRVLRNMSQFAGAIAEGDFQARIASREKGEVGRTLEAMRQIPVVLQSILGDYGKLEKSIEGGEMGAEGNPSAYKGGFATLIQGTNAILGRFLMTLENIPSPVVILGADLKATYVNAAGRNVGGEDYRGKTCKEIMGREDYGSPADALKRAAESLRPASGETVAHPRGANMDVSYTAIPMLNNEGRLAAVLQLITDLTAIKQTQRTIQRVAEQAVAISNQVAAASEKLSAQVEQVSQGAEMQRSRVESTASAMTEMNSTVLEVAHNAGQASEQSELTKGKANDGAVLVGKVVQAINLVNTVATTLQTNMRELGSQAESIGGVMNVISDIADQTNLLALNAAIEAARAGEAGRGFAVVADEVRKLAEKTMSATQEVGANISAIQNSARTNINEVNTAANAITEATALSNTSGQALAEIVDLASANSAVVASIATAAEEQSATSEEINRAIEEINRIVGETTDGMMQSSSAVQDLSRMAQELNKVMAELR